jgi:hypothetical protein
VVRVGLLALLLPSTALAQDPTREGVTFEVGVGPARIYVSPEVAPSYQTSLSLAFNGGAGVWLTPKLVVGGRLAGASNFESSERLGAYVIGPAAQYWLDDKAWVGAGAGLGVLLSSTAANDVGLGFDLRAGFTFAGTGDYVFSGSLEVTPARYFDREDATLTGVALVLALQYL